MGGGSHSPWREVCLETLGPPGPLSCTGGGRGGWVARSRKGGPLALRPVTPPSPWPPNRPWLVPMFLPARGPDRRQQSGLGMDPQSPQHVPGGALPGAGPAGMALSTCSLQPPGRARGIVLELQRILETMSTLTQPAGPSQPFKQRWASWRAQCNSLAPHFTSA